MLRATVWISTACLTLLVGRASCGADKGLLKWVANDLCALVDDDPDGRIQERRMAQITNLGEKGRQALLEVAQSSHSSRGCAMRYLHDLNDPRFLPIARSAARDAKEHDSVRDMALSLLASDRKTLDLFLEIFEAGPGDSAGYLRWSIQGLGLIDDERAREALRAAVKDAKYGAYLSQLVEAIGIQRDKAGVGLLLEIEADDALLAHREDRVRQALTLALARVGTAASREAMPGILRRIQADWMVSRARFDVLRELARQRDEAKDAPERAAIEAVIHEVESIPDPTAKQG